ncbi:acetyl-CoA carboxylase carboxyl transferase subunit alpha [Nocardia inohanensis]|uniref:acetyl-CoA carboxylase carboxyl transferase subunit alpha n=1 Tax=Nocardia inohanensis TaxID=209246 RepID=UPI000AF85E91|nr:acetyl-CoA carboxylase carboxyl transferase subunit alpha [Nocardia inohanensis]
MTLVESDARTAAPPDWVLCGGCRQMLYRKRFELAAQVCPACGWHGPLTAIERLDLLCDPGSVRILEVAVTETDPLRFTDTRPYPQRLREAQARTGSAEAVQCARGTIGGHAAVLAVMDFRFLGGSLGTAVGEAITRAAEIALTERTPLILVTASGGARMQEGILALMQMAKTAQALGQLDAAGILTVAVITDPTFGGVAASFATLPDVIIAEPGARLGFAGRRVIEQTIGQSLPPEFQTAEFLLEHGVVDMIRPRAELATTLAKLLSAGDGPTVASSAEPGAVVIRSGRPGAAVRGSGERDAALPGSGALESDPLESGVAALETGALVTDPARLPEREAWDCVRAARRFGRPTTLDYVAHLVDDFFELHGDRAAADCPAVVAGLGRMAGVPVAVIGTQKGRSTTELAQRNFGMPDPAGYRKAARVMRLAAKLGLPVITLVDTAGAYPGIAAEEQAQAVAIAENLRLLAGLPVPVISVITGEGGSGGALALAVADRVLMCANAVYSVISPEGCASILWKTPGEAARAAAALRVDARSLLELGVIDGVIDEPGAGAETDHGAAAANLRAALVHYLAELLPQDQPTLITARHNRFRRFGANSAVLADSPAEHPRLLGKDAR